jgi:hypothetical protein
VKEEARSICSISCRMTVGLGFCSWNCGHEGPVGDPLVIETRVKQVSTSWILQF